MFLGQLARDLSSEVLSKDGVENADGTHFVINEDNRLILGCMSD